jgi:hypothetical protein
LYLACCVTQTTVADGPSENPGAMAGALNVSSGSLLRVAVCRGGLTRPQAAVVAGDGTSSSRPTTRNGFYGQSSARTEQYDTGRQKNTPARGRALPNLRTGRFQSAAVPARLSCEFKRLRVHRWRVDHRARAETFAGFQRGSAVSSRRRRERKRALMLATTTGSWNAAR